ncbi:MAG: hypothetical protein Q7R35_00215 [Elusimicrobiota bacterium]|nr:hypothetical protein [Elusimicrobiota bacterium]
MDDRDKKLPKPGMPPLPPGMLKPNFPSAPGGPGRPSLPPMPFGALPAAGSVHGPAQPQKDDSAQLRKEAAEAEARRTQEDKDKLEKKITDMEKLLSQEKEKALLATLKNQQDEALSSRVESSLKDIQEKMRRDRRDHEVEEERLALKGKIKEMEMRLSQERETWMQTLKNQMSERETQGRDVEGHFINRLQEMERRWLDEKAQWQKEISSREETIRSLKSASEKLRDLEDEFRKLSLEKSMTEREASKLRDEVARAEREKASIESYIKMIPEKEREIGELRSENTALRGREEMTSAMQRGREEAIRLEAIHRDERNNIELEKFQREIGRLQSEIGSLSDRKNVEKNEELKAVQARYEEQLLEKDKAFADVSGEKIRAISELMKIKGFVSRVQAINAVLDKERGQLKLEKMQLAQNMAAQLEELKRLKAENDGFKAAHQSELQIQAENFKAEVNRVKNGYAVELAHKHAEEMAKILRAHQEETSSAAAARQAEDANTAAAHQAEIASAAATRQAEIASAATAHQEETARMAAAHQEETARMAAANQLELARTAAARQAEMSKMAADYQALLARLTAERQSESDAKISQMRMQYEASAEEEKNALRRQLEESHALQLQEVKAAAAAAQDSVLKLDVDNRRLAADAADFDRALAAKTKEFEDRLAWAEEDAHRQEAEARRQEASRQEAQAAAAAAQKEEAEKAFREVVEERKCIADEYAAMLEKIPPLEARNSAAEAEAAKLAENLRIQTENLRLESENRTRFESELLFLKQKIQQMEFQSQENESQREAERATLANLQAAATGQQSRDLARIQELSAELESYKTLESSLAGRLKWAIKGKKTEE